MIRSPGPKHLDSLLCQTTLAEILIREGHYGEAEKFARELSKTCFVIRARNIPIRWMHLQEVGEAMAYPIAMPRRASFFAT
jgi:hypothetical protein